MRNDIKILVLSFLISTLVWGQGFAKEVSIESLLPQKPLDGWQQIGSAQFYDHKTLFKRVNGQAELFFKYGFKKSVFTLYQSKSNPKSQIEVDLYDMGSVLQAFGIFSRFRGGDRPAGVGLESYYDDASLVFYKGGYFVMLYGMEAEASHLKTVAMTISSRILDASCPPKETNYFPKEGLKPGSIEYYPEGLLGYQFLKRGFLAAYLRKGKERKNRTVEDREGHLFLAIFKNSKDSEDALGVYKSTLSKRGKVEPTMPPQFGPKGIKGEDPNHGKVIVVAKGFYLAGTVGFDDVGHAETLLQELVRNIR